MSSWVKWTIEIVQVWIVPAGFGMSNEKQELADLLLRGMGIGALLIWHENPMLADYTDRDVFL